jgi:hypothetical protein
MTDVKRIGIVAAVLATIVLAGTWRPASAQAPRNEDVLPALLVEVRGLRAAMEQMASGSTQAQLLVGRLQLQEARVTSMIRRLDTVRDNLAGARAAYNQIAGSLGMLERSAPGDTSQHDKDDILPSLKAQVAAAKDNVDRLAAEELQLTADIAVEQQRWTAINQRLDDLERTLTKR